MWALNWTIWAPDRPEPLNRLSLRDSHRCSNVSITERPAGRLPSKGEVPLKKALFTAVAALGAAAFMLMAQDGSKFNGTWKGETGGQTRKQIGRASCGKEVR